MNGRKGTSISMFQDATVFLSWTNDKDNTEVPGERFFISRDEDELGAGNSQDNDVASNHSFTTAASRKTETEIETAPSAPSGFMKTAITSSQSPHSNSKFSGSQEIISKKLRAIETRRAKIHSQIELTNIQIALEDQSPGTTIETSTGDPLSQKLVTARSGLKSARCLSQQQTPCNAA